MVIRLHEIGFTRSNWQVGDAVSMRRGGEFSFITSTVSALRGFSQSNNECGL
jgi:hypothetical protein